MWPKQKWPKKSGQKNVAKKKWPKKCGQKKVAKTKVAKNIVEKMLDFLAICWHYWVYLITEMTVYKEFFGKSARI